MLDESRLSTLANELLDSLIMQYKAGIDGGGGSKLLPGHPAQQSLAAYEELMRVGLVKASPSPSLSDANPRWVLTPKGKQLVTCTVGEPSL